MLNLHPYMEVEGILLMKNRSDRLSVTDNVIIEWTSNAIHSCIGCSYIDRNIIRGWFYIL